jgi:hypothetical protein
MKYKLKDLKFDTIEYTSSHVSNLGKVINMKESIEFQTPKVKIVNIDDEYLTLKILPSEACRIFFLKIMEFEEKIKQEFKDIVQLFDGDVFKVKIKNKNFKIYLNGTLFNVYHLKKDMEIICLVSICKLWINAYNIASYHLKVDEMVIKEK